ncbi:protein kinase [Nostoc sp.]|uniref:protein kinase domain-containing protein n=1 Tax=Nostoc sp. TaxID=1180 RepID=UPI002FF5E59A
MKYASSNNLHRRYRELAHSTRRQNYFSREARRLQQLGEHPQIPTLFAYFEEDKRLYLVQQYVEGQNLLEELQHQGIFSEWEG